MTAPNDIAPVVITRCGNVLTLSRADDMPFSQEFVNALTHDLRYSHVEQIHGAAQRNPITGQRQYFKTTEYKLFRHEHGKIIILGGYLARLAAKLKNWAAKRLFGIRLQSVSAKTASSLCGKI